MKFTFDDFEITIREILVSIILFCIMLALGLIICNKIDEHYIKKDEKINKALKINDDNEKFKYAIDTSVGNLINYGKFETIDPIKDEWLVNTYLAYEKITEEYKKHTRTVCSGSGKSRSCHTETYHSWDEIDSDENFSERLLFSLVEFPVSRFENYNWKRLKISKETINGNIGYLKNDYIYENDRLFDKVNDKRYYYEIVEREFYGTTVAIAKDKDYIAEDNKKIYIHNQNLEDYIEEEKSNKTAVKVVFWTIYLIIIGVVIYLFVYAENNYLE